MKTTHPVDFELAALDDGVACDNVGDHLRWCARCRSALAGYRWLQGELETTLTAVADAVPVPRPRWRVVRGRLLAGQRRRVARWRVSALATVALTVCAMLFAPIFLSPVGAARVPQPEVGAAVAVPTPADPTAAATPSVQAATPTPAVLRSDASSTTPVVELFPTPTEPEA